MAKKRNIDAFAEAFIPAFTASLAAERTKRERETARGEQREFQIEQREDEQAFQAAQAVAAATNQKALEDIRAKRQIRLENAKSGVFTATSPVIGEKILKGKTVPVYQDDMDNRLFARAMSEDQEQEIDDAREEAIFKSEIDRAELERKRIQAQITAENLRTEILRKQQGEDSIVDRILEQDQNTGLRVVDDIVQFEKEKFSNPKAAARAMEFANKTAQIVGSESELRTLPLERKVIYTGAFPGKPEGQSTKATVGEIIRGLEKEPATAAVKAEGFFEEVTKGRRKAQEEGRIPGAIPQLFRAGLDVGGGIAETIANVPGFLFGRQAPQDVPAITGLGLSEIFGQAPGVSPREQQLLELIELAEPRVRSEF